MPFPADENFIYRIPNADTSPFMITSCTRGIYAAGGLATDTARTVNNTPNNIPNAGATPTLAPRRLVEAFDAPAPFNSAPYSGVHYKRVSSSFPATGTTPGFDDFLSGGVTFIGERDFYRWYFLAYLAAVNGFRARAGQVAATDWDNLTYLVGLLGANFVAGATLPEIPRY